MGIQIQDLSYGSKGCFLQREWILVELSTVLDIFDVQAIGLGL